MIRLFLAACLALVALPVCLKPYMWFSQARPRTVRVVGTGLFFKVVPRLCKNSPRWETSLARSGVGAVLW